MVPLCWRPDRWLRRATRRLQKVFPPMALTALSLTPNLPDGDGLDLVPEMRAHWPSARMVVLTEDTNEVPSSLASVHKGDIPSLISALALPVDIQGAPQLGRC